MYFGFSKQAGIKSIAKVVKKSDTGNTCNIKQIKEKQKDDKEKIQLIDLVSSDNKDDLCQELFIDDEDLELQPLMVLHDGDCPNRMYIAGQSYCGKSTCASKMAQDWNSVFPKSKVAYISYNLDDKACNDKNIENFVKITVDNKILEDPLELEEFHDKLVIFDDIEAYGDPHIIKALEQFVKKCINTGRHKNIGTIVCRQKLLAGHKSSDILNGIHQLVTFPHSGSRFQLRNYLKSHLHLPQHKIEKLLNVPSRWLLINLVNPCYALHAKGGFII